VIGIEPLDETRKIAEAGHSSSVPPSIGSDSRAQSVSSCQCSTDHELGLTELQEVADRTLGAEGLPWYVSYRVCVGVK